MTEDRRATTTQAGIATSQQNAGKVTVPRPVSSPVTARQVQGDDSSSRPGQKVEPSARALGQLNLHHSSGKDRGPLGWAPGQTCRWGARGGPRWDRAIHGCWRTRDHDPTFPMLQMNILTTHLMLSFSLWPCKYVVWSTKTLICLLVYYTVPTASMWPAWMELQSYQHQVLRPYSGPVLNSLLQTGEKKKDLKRNIRLLRRAHLIADKSKQQGVKWKTSKSHYCTGWGSNLPVIYAFSYKATIC